MYRFAAVVCWVLLLWKADVVAAAADGKRAVDVPRFGVHVRVPQAWDLVDWSRNDTAFVLDLPQDAASPVGHVACAIGVDAESLEAVRDRFAKGEPPAPLNVPGADTLKPVKRTLLRNTLEAVTENGPAEAGRVRFARRLTAEWELEDKATTRWYERRVYAVGDDVLYTFLLDSDEAHYDAYAADFEEMLATAKILPLQLAVAKGTQGYWVQRDFRFALRLPAGWRPAPSPHERILFYAVGRGHGARTDDLEVRASPPQVLDLEKLQAEMPTEVKRLDAQARVECRIVRQTTGPALETVVATKRGAIEVTTIERRFRTALRNYEVKFTCETQEFDRLRQAIAESLDGFAELPADSKASET